MSFVLDQYLIVAALLFAIGAAGIIVGRRNVLRMLLALELMLLAANINLVAFSQTNVTGHIFALFVLTVAAAEAAIGLAILVIYFRTHGTVVIEAEALRG